MRALIIDDNRTVHKQLIRVLSEEHPDVVVEGNAYDFEEGIKLALEVKPDILFLDIDLGDRTGFELLRKLREKGLDLNVIFVTGFDSYAITAIRFGAIDYLVKPVQEDELAAALDRVREEHQPISGQQITLMDSAYPHVNAEQLPSILTIKSRSETHYIPVGDICRLEADGPYTTFYFAEDRPIISSQNLGKYVEQFRLYKNFVQVHRSHMINLDYVRKFKRSEQLVVLSDGSEVGLGGAYSDGFHSGMENL